MRQRTQVPEDQESTESIGEAVRRRSSLLRLVRRAVGRPYLFMAAVILIVGAIWFARLALQEFLLLDRLINVYTNDAQIKMEAFAIKPGVTAEVVEVVVSEGDTVQKGQIIMRLQPDDFRAELLKAEAVAESIRQQQHELRLEHPLTVEQAKQEVARAQAMLETRGRAVQRARVLVGVQRDRVSKMLGEHRANLDAAQARLQEQEVALRETEVKLERTRSLFQEGILPQERLDADQMALERAQTRVTAAREQVRQADQHYPPGDSPEMVQVHEQDAHRAVAEVEEQRAALRLAQTKLRLAESGEQRFEVLKARLQEAEAQVEALRLKLDKTIIRSPVDGIVGYRKVEPGEIVEGDPSNPPLMVIHNPHGLWVTANVWESDISRVRVGLPAEIWIDAFRTSALGRGKPFKGTVLRVNPTTSSEVSPLPPERFFTRREQKVPVTIALENTSPGFRAGMLAEVLILLDDGATAQEQKR